MPALRVKSRLEYYQKKKCRKSKVRALLQLIVQDKRGGAWEERGSKKKKKNQHLNDFFLSVLCAKILFSSNYSSVHFWRNCLTTQTWQGAWNATLYYERSQVKMVGTTDLMPNPVLLSCRLYWGLTGTLSLTESMFWKKIIQASLSLSTKKCITSIIGIHMFKINV